MAGTRKGTLFEGYLKVEEPDLGVMADMVRAAKGDRSLADFASDCGLNISTLSRIINNKNNGPSSDEVLARIALNASSESGVTIEDLLIAAGRRRSEGAPSAMETLQELEYEFMVEHMSMHVAEHTRAQEMLARIVSRSDAEDETLPVDVTEKKAETETAERMLTYHSFISASVYRQTLLDALIALNYQVSLEKDLTAITGIEFDCYAEFVLKTNALDAEGLDKWAFIKLKETGNRATGKLTSYFGMMFAHNPVKEGKRITLLIEDKATYDILRELLQCVEIPASFSLMLVDTKDRKVISEYVMDRSDGVEPVRLFNAGGPTEWEEIFGTPDEANEK